MRTKWGLSLLCGVWGLHSLCLRTQGEVKEMELRIGVLQHATLYHKLRQSNSKNPPQQGPVKKVLPTVRTPIECCIRRELLGLD